MLCRNGRPSITSLCVRPRDHSDLAKDASWCVGLQHEPTDTGRVDGIHAKPDILEVALKRNDGPLGCARQSAGPAVITRH